MKNLKKTLSVILAALMLLSCLALSAFAAGGKITVTLRVEGIKTCLYYGKVTLDENSTALDALMQADKDSTALTVTVADSQFGEYVSAINGESEKREEYKNILASNDRHKLLSLVKTIQYEKEARRQCGKKLNLNDEQTLAKAENLLYNELGFVLEIEPNEVKSMIEF